MPSRDVNVEKSMEELLAQVQREYADEGKKATQGARLNRTLPRSSTSSRQTTALLCNPRPETMLLGARPAPGLLPRFRNWQKSTRRGAG